MVEITLQVPERLADRLRLMGPWVAAAIELSLCGFKTSAARTAAEIIDFLSTSPDADQVLNYQLSNRSQEQRRRVLALNRTGAPSRGERAELDELEQIDNILIMLRGQADEMVNRGPP